MNYEIRNDAGQSMFEVVIAIFIIAMIIVGVVSLTTISVSNSVFSRNKTLAGKYSQEAIEWLRSQREANFTTFKTNAVGTRCLNTLTFTAPPCQFINTIFKRQVTFTTTTNPTIIKAEVITSWTDSKGTHQAVSTTEFTDIREK
ncbi:MAG: hypothetical protein ACD_19C00176G0054 [uncultured bacterium]|nr:MAG: hypothetical protein ACD_19C00176G0054 [uncultured bacterium]HBY01671.1 hypothetical protein [Rikenellaceae bacterium]